MTPVFALWLQAQAAFAIQPAVITRCSAEGLGRATLVWAQAGPGPVQVRVGGPDGAQMTGPEPPSGSAETGDWVRDGMVFALVDEAGRELARVTARVACGAAADTYFPLHVGDEWVYRVNSRIATSTYAIRRIGRADSIGGQTWFVMTHLAGDNQRQASELRYRSDEQARIYQLTERGEERLWLDPAGSLEAVLRVEARGVPFRSALGAFPDALRYRQDGMALEFGTLVRGLGFVESSSNLLAGSSGGFLQSFELVSARIAGNLVYRLPAASLQLAAEAAEFNVSGRQVTNCAVPCYFVACGLVPGADPPNTFKPCFQARVEMEDTGSSAARMVDLELLDATGRAVIRGTHELAPRAGRPDWLLLRQVPLYTAPNEPVPPGEYRLRAAGEAGTASLAIRVR